MEDDTTSVIIDFLGLNVTRPPLVSDLTLEKLETVGNGAILPVLVLCGVIGNVINMAVFVRQGLGDRINLCLFSLAVSDSGFLLSYLPSRIYILFYLFDSALGRFWEAHWFYFIGVYHAFLNMSNSLTLVISLERCICVTSPLRAKRMFSSRAMAAAILVLFILSLAGNIMGSFKYTAMEITDSVANITEIRTATTDFYLNNRRAFHAVHEVTFNVIIPAISLVVVIAATLVIAVRMRTVLAWRKDTAHVGSSNHSSTTNQREAAVTRMLLVVCMIYSICTTPSVIQALLRTFVADFVGGGPYNNIFFASLVITHLLESVNCSINFIIYYTMSTRFRETLRDMVHRGDVKKRKQQVESNTRVSALSASEGIDP